MLIYINIIRIAAVLIIVLGLISLAMGIGIATGKIIEPEPGMYLGSRTSGEAIDDGIIRIVFGIVIGALAEIGRISFKKKNSN